MISLLVSLLVLLVVLAILWWLFQQLPLPPPFRWVAALVMGLIAIALLLYYVKPALLH